jgi:hypothetical protein
VGVPTLAILGLPLGSPETKSYLDVGPMERCRVYYKGKGGGFPQVHTVVSLVCPCCLWLILAPKVLELCSNHLALVLCRSVWVDKACQLFLVPSRSSSIALYPSKVLRTKERASTPYFFVVFYLGFTFESFKELGVRHVVSELWESSIYSLGSPDGTKEVP